MRPIYETDKDRENQQSVADLVAVFIGGRLIKTPHMSAIDYIVQDMKGTATGLLEVKVRRYTPEELEEMGGFFLSERKLLLIYKTVQLLKMDFHLVVQAEKSLLHLLLKEGSAWPKLERKVGGRFDRQDAKDVETLCIFPMRMFTRLE